MMVSDRKKESLKIFLFLFLLFYFIINWNDSSWIFNYKEVNGLVYEFFNPYQESSIVVKADNSPALDFLIEIPKIGITAPVVVSESTDKEVLAEDLDRGTVYYPGSVKPGQNGQIFVLGHSAPPNWPKIKYDWVFSDIESLADGDKVTLYFNGKKYDYKVSKKEIIKIGQEINIDEELNSKNVLVLISCWPPGKNYQRIAVYTELI